MSERTIPDGQSRVHLASRLSSPSPPDDPDLREVGQTILEQLKAGTEAVIAQARIPEQRATASSPSYARGRTRHSLQAAVESLLSGLDQESRQRVMTRARDSLASRRPDLLTAADPIAFALAPRPQDAASRALRTTISQVSVNLGNGGASKGWQPPERVAIHPDGSAIEIAYRRFRVKLGARQGEARHVKDHRGRGCVVLRCKNGAVIFGPEPEAFAIWGSIYKRFVAEGGIGGFEGGPPVTSVQKLEDGGAVAHFCDSYSLARARGGDVHVLSGAIRERWLDDKNTGYPTSDVAPTKDGLGLRCFTEQGLYLWSRPFGTRFIPEQLLAAWREQGGLDGTLGWPIADARWHPPSVYHLPPGGLPYVNMRFEGGSIWRMTSLSAPVVSHSITRVKLRLDSLFVERATEIGKDEPFLGGTVFGLDGQATQVGSFRLGKFKSGQTRRLEKEVASWSLIQKNFPRWPVPCVFVATFWEDDPGRGGHETVVAAWKEIQSALDKAIKAGATKLGDYLAQWIGALGSVVGILVARLVSWLLDMFLKWLAKAVGDDAFAPYVLATAVQDGWVSTTSAIATLRDMRTEEVNPFGKRRAVYVADWSFHAE